LLLAVVGDIDTGFDLLVDDPAQCRLANLSDNLDTTDPVHRQTPVIADNLILIREEIAIATPPEVSPREHCGSC
jgi:hypothetical protein